MYMYGLIPRPLAGVNLCATFDLQEVQRSRISIICRGEPRDKADHSKRGRDYYRILGYLNVFTLSRGVIKWIGFSFMKL